MKLKHILENRTNQVKSYDKELGKIVLDVIKHPDYTAHQYKGKNHRNDGKPAVVWPDGVEEWYKHGKFHREDGPAIMYESGKVSWWLNGKQYLEKEWKKKVGKK